MLGKSWRQFWKAPTYAEVLAIGLKNWDTFSTGWTPKKTRKKLESVYFNNIISFVFVIEDEWFLR